MAFYADSSYSHSANDQAWGLYSPYNQNYVEMIRVGGLGPQREALDSIALAVKGLVDVSGSVSDTTGSQFRGLVTISNTGSGSAIQASSYEAFGQGRDGTGGYFTGARGVFGFGYSGAEFQGLAGGIFDPVDAYGVSSAARTFTSLGRAYAFHADSTYGGNKAWAFHADYNTSFFKRSIVGADLLPRYNGTSIDSSELTVIGRSIFMDTTDEPTGIGVVHVEYEGTGNDAALTAFNTRGPSGLKAIGVGISTLGSSIGLRATAGSPTLPPDAIDRSGGILQATSSGSGFAAGAETRALAYGSGNAYGLYASASRQSGGTGEALGVLVNGGNIGTFSQATNEAGNAFDAIGIEAYALNNSPQRAIGLLIRESVAQTDADEYAIYSDFNKSYIKRLAVGSDRFATGYELSVDGGIIATQMTTVVPSTANWPDYVFRDDYALAPLSEVKSYIREHGHLPGIPSAADVKRDGQHIDLTQRALLEKIEELTLHLIAEQEARQRAEADLEVTRATLDEIIVRLRRLESATTD